MYRFQLHGVSCECDSADELRSALNSKPSAGATTSPSVARAVIAKRQGRKPAAAGTASAAQQSWDEARKEAKRQGRSDVAKVRSELAQAKKAR